VLARSLRVTGCTGEKEVEVSGHRLRRIRVGALAAAIASGSIVGSGCNDTAPGPAVFGGSNADAPPDLDRGADGSASVVVRQIAPAATDPTITRWTEDHVVMRDPTTPPNGQLLVFFAGSMLLPSDYRFFLATAAGRGYLTIGLRYANSWDASSLEDTADPACTRRARLEIVDGLDRSTAVDVGPVNSILHRLTALVGYLDRQYPAEGWGQFLAAGQLQWRKIVVAGHSFGSGEAAMIGLTYRTARVILLAGPNDHCFGSTAATVQDARGVTPCSYANGFQAEDNDATRRGGRVPALAFTRGRESPGPPFSESTSELG
jgi:hypothetical protein